MIAMDYDYEALRLTWRRETIWDTTRRMWVTTDVSPLRWGVCPQPADPDAALEAARVGGGWSGVQVSRRDAGHAARILDYLREYGPAPARHIWTTIHMDFATFEWVGAQLVEAGAVAFVWQRHPRTGMQVRMWQATDNDNG